MHPATIAIADGPAHGIVRAMRKTQDTWPIRLDRPLGVFDIEATGATPRADRIVELAVVRILPDGRRDTHKWRINPEMPIPPEATAIHGIRDADVAACPPFRQVAQEILGVFADCDLAGYNLGRFDVPMLAEEFSRVSIAFDLEGRRIIDAQRIFHRHEPRDLAAALAFYCGEMHLDAHGAEPDVLATIRVLEGQFARYADLPHDLDGLDAYCNPRHPAWVDRQGRLKWAQGEIVLNFGRKKGETLRHIIQDDPGFVKWLLRSDFPRDVQEIVSNASEGRWPTPPKDLSLAKDADL